MLLYVQYLFVLGSVGWQLAVMMLRVDLLQPDEVHERQAAERRVVDDGASVRRRVTLEGRRRGLQAVQKHGRGVREAYDPCVATGRGGVCPAEGGRPSAPGCLSAARSPNRCIPPSVGPESRPYR